MMITRNYNRKLIDFLRLPRPHFASLKLRESEDGSEENQFTPHGAGVNKLIFKRSYINE
jgi:hypothetical protein